MNKFDLNSILSNKKIMRIIVITAFLGIALIALSDFLPQKSEEITTEISTSSDYSKEIEEKIINLICAITGEKNPEVMLTLEASEQFVYAKEIKESENSSEETYIIVENSDGDEMAIVITEIEPQVKGIVIASEFAENFTIKESLINAVSTVLDLPSNKVCVVTKK
ncbi:MAG: hypothetical protein R3Y33_06350 [Clostridia bacterium]